MGTKMALACANLFMGKLEEKLKEFGKPHIMVWKRFMDDSFVVWTGSTSKFTTCMTVTSTKHTPQSSSHNYESSETKLIYLDLTLYKVKDLAETNS